MEIPVLPYTEYFQDKLGLGYNDICFLDIINVQFICLASSVLYDILYKYSSTSSMEAQEFWSDILIGKAAFFHGL